MNAVELIRDDHRRMKSLFRDFAETADANEKQQIAEDAFVELQVHTQIEEQVFFPAIRERDAARYRAAVDESLAIHTHIDEIIQGLKGLRPGAGDYDRRFSELVREAERHIEEEEQLLPAAEQQLSAELDRLGDQMKRLKSQLAEAA